MVLQAWLLFCSQLQEVAERRLSQAQLIRRRRRSIEMPCFNLDLDDLLAYKTVKTISVRHRWLGGIYYGMMLAILGWTTYSVLAPPGQYKKTIAVYGAVRASVREPQPPAGFPPLGAMHYCAPPSSPPTGEFSPTLPCTYPDMCASIAQPRCSVAGVHTATPPPRPPPVRALHPPLHRAPLSGPCSAPPRRHCLRRASGELSRVTPGDDGALLVGTRLSTTHQVRNPACNAGHAAQRDYTCPPWNDAAAGKESVYVAGLEAWCASREPPPSRWPARASLTGCRPLGRPPPTPRSASWHTAHTASWHTSVHLSSAPALWSSLWPAQYSGVRPQREQDGPAHVHVLNDLRRLHPL